MKQFVDSDVLSHIQSGTYIQRLNVFIKPGTQSVPSRLHICFSLIQTRWPGGVTKLNETPVLFQLFLSSANRGTIISYYFIYHCIIAIISYYLSINLLLFQLFHLQFSDYYFLLFFVVRRTIKFIISLLLFQLIFLELII